MAVITIDGLTKRFGDIVAVDDLSFEVDQGTVVGFLGPNGAGKTTTLRMLLGLVTPTAGSTRIDDRPYRELTDPIRHVGAVLEASSIPAAAPATTSEWSPPPPVYPWPAPTRSWSRSASPRWPTGGSVASRSACANAWA
jgi:ABC-type Mn2+/Zn2+ transport system ATPase subunit